MAAQTVLILDFGGQYKELIARRVRECGVYSIVKPGDISLDKIREIDPIGIILTGGPNSVYEKESPHCDKAIFDIGIPVLGICYGMQLLSWSLGGEVSPCSSSEYGRTKMQVSTDSPLFAGLDPAQIGLMSHTDQVTKLPAGFRSIAHTVSCENAAIENAAKKLYGFQFHPEVESTPNGTAMIRSFLYSVCGAKGDYDLKNLEQQLISDVKKQVGDAHVLLALSGGVDSSVCIQILRDQGFDVQAVVIRFSPAHDAAVRAAQTVARQLGVPLIEEDCTEEFEQQVVEPFCAQYCAGRTPSPCVLCNPRVKFAALARVADRLGIRYIATGHYARVTEENGLYYVRAAVSPERDQSYMLYGLPQNILARLCLPVGEFEKSDIREMAASAQLASADAPDSQEICFIPDGDYAAYIAARGLVPLQGRFIGPDGEDLGPHKGCLLYTSPSPRD